MFCTKCGTQLPEGLAFCTKCGSALKNNESTQINNPQPSSVNINLGQGQMSEARDSVAIGQTTTGLRKKENPNRVLVAIITLLFGWLGIHNFVWGKKVCGVIQLVLLILWIASINESFGMDIVSWVTFTSLFAWIAVDSVLISNGKFFGRESESNSVAVIPIVGYVFCALVGIYAVVESVSDYGMDESDAVYSMEEIENAYISPSEKTDKYADAKYTIIGIIKDKEDSYNVVLDVAGRGSIKKATMSFFNSEEIELQKYNAGTKISAYCVARKVQDGEFKAEKCVLK